MKKAGKNKLAKPQGGDQLEHNIIKKVHIIGSVGSGKTTLAKRLSNKLDVPYYELDNVVWERSDHGDKRRSPQERKANLQDIISKESWIIEGVHNEDWVYSSFRHADVILYLDIPVSIRNYRIIRRFLLQKAGFEKAHYKPTLNIFLKMFKWNKQFETYKPKIRKKLEPYHKKVIILNDRDDIKHFLVKLYSGR